jgi:hypothetical protein
VDAQRPLGPSTRFKLAPSATRRLGPDLLVNAGGATASVQRLMGTGPELWHCFARGLTVAEAAAHLADRFGAPADVEANALEFGASLISSHLAEPVW